MSFNRRFAFATSTLAALVACSSALAVQQPGSAYFRQTPSGYLPPIVQSAAIDQPRTFVLESPLIQEQAPPQEPVAALQPAEAKEQQPAAQTEEETKQDAEPETKTALMSALACTRFGCCLDHHKIGITGWTEMSYTASSADGNQLPMGFNYEANDFLLQQNWLRVDRPVDPESDCPTHGFRIDTILPGSDYRFTIARGLFDGQLAADGGAPNRYGIDMVQFYAVGYRPDLAQGTEIKIGRFFSPYGAESIDTTQTPLPSRSYSFIYNPFTNTGVLATSQLNESWSVWNGVVAGNDVFVDAASSPYYIGGMKWAPPEGRSSFQFVTLLGSGEFDVEESFHNPQIFDLLLTYQLNDQLKWMGEGLYGYTEGVPGLGYADWYGIVNYLTWQPCEHVSRTLRLEFFDDTEGQRTGTSGLYTAITLGAARKVSDWLTIRPEVRYDHNSNAPFSGDADLFTADLSAIIFW